MKKYSSKKNLIITYTVYFFIFLITIFATLNAAASEMVKKFAVSEVRKEASIVIANALRDAVGNSEYPLSSATVVKYSDSGKISSIEENTQIINMIQSDISTKINKNLENAFENTSIQIPAGNFSGLVFLSGKGAPLDFNAAYSGNAVTKIDSEFISAGINQTMHEIKITVSSRVTVLLPFDSVDVDIEETYIICDTVIIGEVPESYADIL